MNSYNEKELLTLASGGCEEAFTALYNMYKHKLYSFSLRLRDSPELAKDLSQDIFLKIWKDRSQLSQIENFGGYIFKLAQNQAFNAVKRMANETLILSKIQKSTDLYPNNTEADIHYKYLRKSVSDAIETLTPQQKLIYKLSREEGLKHDEIAKQLRLSPSTVKTHLGLALQTIRKHLSRNFDFASALLAVILLYCLKK